MSDSVTRTTCPPHYWLIDQDQDGERWDCQICGLVRRPSPQSFLTRGERTCTWSREERFLAGITD